MLPVLLHRRTEGNCFFYPARVKIQIGLDEEKIMTNAAPAKSRKEQRFEREAKALQKNLEKRKLQQKKREELKKTAEKPAEQE